jgi:hypothetical protein
VELDDFTIDPMTWNMLLQFAPSHGLKFQATQIIIFEDNVIEHYIRM